MGLFIYIMGRVGALNIKNLSDKSTSGNKCGQRKIHGMFQAIGS